MYFSPQLYDNRIELKVFTSAGVPVTVYSSSGITSMSVGYYQANTYVPIKTLTDLITTIDPSTLDISNLFCNIITSTTNDILPVANLITIIRQSYSCSFSVDKVPTVTSNMLLDRANFFMPKWSPAYQNDISTFSKIYYPIFEQLEKILTRSYSYMSSNFRGLPSSYLKTPLRKLPIMIEDLDTNKQIVETFNLDNSIINSINILPTSYQGILFKTAIEVLSLPLIFTMSPKYIFAKKTVYGAVEVHIEGLDINRNFVQETLVVANDELSRSLVKYSKVFSITSNDTDVIISNYVDCSEDITYKPKDSLRLLVDSNKDFAPSFPMKVTTGDILEIYSTIDNSVSLYQYSLDIPIVNTYCLFVTPQNDLILLNDGQLYSGVLTKPLDTSVSVQDVNNNNLVVYVENTEVIVGTPFSFVIDFEEYQKNFIGSNFYIKLQVNDEITFMNQSKEFQTDMVDYSITNSDTKLYIDLEYEYGKVYMLSLMDGSRNFSAYTVANSVQFTHLFDMSLVGGDGGGDGPPIISIYSMYHDGDELYIRDNGDVKDYIVHTSKNYYELHDDNGILMPTNIKNIQVTYKDYSKDIITI